VISWAEAANFSYRYLLDGSSILATGAGLRTQFFLHSSTELHQPRLCLLVKDTALMSIRLLSMATSLLLRIFFAV
jgi:hypothetical protein